MAQSKPPRTLPPLSYIFRDAFEKRDSRKHIYQTDESGVRVVSGRRGLSKYPIRESDLRREVQTNVESLFNTVHLDAAIDLDEMPEVRASIINFGLPDLASYTIEDVGVDEIGVAIQRALMEYEPRCEPKSIRAVRDYSINPHALHLRFLISAELRAEPLNIPVEFVAEVDTEFAKFRVGRI